MSEGYTADRLISLGRALAASDYEERNDRLPAGSELDAELISFGVAWKVEVRALRERIAALEAERAARLFDRCDTSPNGGHVFFGHEQGCHYCRKPWPAGVPF